MMSNFRFWRSVLALTLKPFHRADSFRRTSPAPSCRSCQTLQQLALINSLPLRSTQPSPQACRVAVEDRSAGFAHATTPGAATIAFALPCRQCEIAAAEAQVARMIYGPALKDAGQPRR